jgi:hypothetical protein
LNSGYQGTLEVVAVGDELALIFPQDLVDHLQASERDTFYLEPTATGFLLRTSPPHSDTLSGHDGDSFQVRQLAACDLAPALLPI